MKQILAAVLFATLIISGCSGLPEGSLKKPTITYLRTEVTGVSLEKVKANVIFQAVNPNKVSLDMVSMDYQLFLEGSKALSGEGLKFNFLADSTTEFTVPVEVQYSSFFKTAENLTKAVLGGKKTASFTVKTVFIVDLTMITVEMPVNISGELPLPEISAPQIKIPKPKFKF